MTQNVASRFGQPLRWGGETGYHHQVTNLCANNYYILWGKQCPPGRAISVPTALCCNSLHPPVPGIFGFKE